MGRARVLIVEDDQAFAGNLERALEGLYQVDLCHSEAQFRSRFAINRYDLLIIDMRLETDREGLTLLKEVLSRDPNQAAIVMTAYADMETYTDAIESGALTYLDKRELTPTLIACTVEAIIQQGQLLRRLAIAEQRLERVAPLEIIGASPAIRRVRELIVEVAGQGDMPVLVSGEPGSGKELVARNIHRYNRYRCEGPLVWVRCDHLGRPERDLATTPESWLDRARGGVLLVRGVAGIGTGDTGLVDLVEVLLTANDQRRTLGGPQLVVTTVTSQAGRSQPDPRLRAVVGREGGLEIEVPPLRDRTEDISLIAQYTLQHLYRQGRSRTRSFRGRAMAQLESLPWPGNVRELRLLVEHAAILSDIDGKQEIAPEHLPLSVAGAQHAQLVPTALDYRLHLARCELALVESTIEGYETDKVGDLAEKLRYNDRFTFSRRIRRVIQTYPALQGEFPRTTRLFSKGGR